MRLVALASLLLLGACATAPALDGQSALDGHGFDTATNLYGPWDERVALEGRESYIWRRAVSSNGKAYYCELLVQTGFRQTIAKTEMRGFPAACSLFSAQYQNPYKRKPTEPAKTLAATPDDRPPGATPIGTPVGTLVSASARISDQPR